MPVRWYLSNGLLGALWMLGWNLFIFSIYTKNILYKIDTQSNGLRISSSGVYKLITKIQICLCFSKKSGIHILLVLHPQSNVHWRTMSWWGGGGHRRSVVNWMRLCSVHCPPGICSLDRSCQALCSWINAARHCRVFHTCWSRFLDRVWRRAACTEGWRPVGDRKTYQEQNEDYFKLSLKAMGCPSLPSHIGHVSVHSGSGRTLSSRE